MAGPDRDEIDALAGEYVLGTLSGEERRAAEARYAADPAFRRAVSEWEDRLQPLANSAGERPLPAGLLTRIEERIDRRSAAPGANVVALHRQVRRWRIVSALAGAAAAVLAVVVVLDQLRPPVQSEFVAVLTAEGASPAFVATVNVKAGTLSIRRIVAPPPDDRSYEVWAVEPDAVPVSLGVLDDQTNLSRGLQATPADLTLAITLEPKGGSPTGKPTGPIVFSGQLVPAD